MYMLFKLYTYKANMSFMFKKQNWPYIEVDAY